MSLGICISDKFPGDTEAAGPGSCSRLLLLPLLSQLDFFFLLSPDDLGPRREALTNFNYNHDHDHTSLNNPLL